MSQRFDKLVALLKELFQLDQPDLDFGFYRVSVEASQRKAAVEVSPLPLNKGERRFVGDLRRVAFVDPKGIRNLGLTDPKIGFHETVKEIERRLGDPNVMLDSFIVSNTPSHVMRKLWGIEKPEMVKRHILFQDEDRASYIAAMQRGVAVA